MKDKIIELYQKVLKDENFEYRDDGGDSYLVEEDTKGFGRIYISAKSNSLLSHNLHDIYIRKQKTLARRICDRGEIKKDFNIDIDQTKYKYDKKCVSLYFKEDPEIILQCLCDREYVSVEEKIVKNVYWFSDDVYKYTKKIYKVVQKYTISFGKLVYDISETEFNTLFKEFEDAEMFHNNRILVKKLNKRLEDF